jgi:hypothetical protein
VHYFALWLSFHRYFFLILIAFSLWAGSYAFYFKATIQRWLHAGRPHSWSVDLAAKTAVARGKQTL